MWDALKVLFWSLAVAVLFQGWPKFITINHYHVNKKDDDK